MIDYLGLMKHLPEMLAMAAVTGILWFTCSQIQKAFSRSDKECDRDVLK